MMATPFRASAAVLRRRLSLPGPVGRALLQPAFATSRVRLKTDASMCAEIGGEGNDSPNERVVPTVRPPRLPPRAKRARLLEGGYAFWRPGRPPYGPVPDPSSKKSEPSSAAPSRRRAPKRRRRLTSSPPSRPSRRRRLSGRPPRERRSSHPVREAPGAGMASRRDAELGVATPRQLLGVHASA